MVPWSRIILADPGNQQGLLVYGSRLGKWAAEMEKKKARQEFVAVLQGVLSNSNGLRAHSEETLNQLEGEPSKFLKLLCQALKGKLSY